MSGVLLNHTVLRLSANADDLVVMVNGQQDIDVLNDIFKDFKLLSSAIVKSYFSRRLVRYLAKAPRWA